MTITDHYIDLKLDTGTQANIISKHVFDKLQLNDQQLSKTRVKLVTYGGKEITPKGMKTLECSVRGEKYNLSYFIVDANTQAILGKSACTEIESIVRVHSVNKDLSQENLLKSYEDVFK